MQSLLPMFGTPSLKFLFHYPCKFRLAPPRHGLPEPVLPPHLVMLRREKEQNTKGPKGVQMMAGDFNPAGSLVTPAHLFRCSGSWKLKAAMPHSWALCP